MTDRALATLESLRGQFGRQVAADKLAQLDTLTRARFTTPAKIARLHELLCFMRAYPDNRRVLARVESLLDAFADRPDLRRHRDKLRSSGIAGTATHFPFCWLTAQWLVERWPERLTIDWDKLKDDEPLIECLGLLRAYPDSGAMVELDAPAREWIELMKSEDETDAAFVVRRIQALPCSEAQRGHLFDSLRLPLRVELGAELSRSTAKWPGASIAFQTSPWDQTRPDLRPAVLHEPQRVRDVSPRRGRALIDRAQEAMLVRNRDLDAISWADPRHVQLVDWDNGLQFAWLGLRPEHRPMFEGVYVYLTLKNGVPIGYVQAAALFGSAFINYNIFEPWRGGEAARIYGQALATARHMLDLDTFAIDVYQLGGDGNDEALATGAWWFYYKMGFRPRDPAVKRVLRGELARLKARPRHRSSIATLKKLAAGEMFFSLGKERSDLVGLIDFGEVGLRIMGYLAERFGSRREHGLEICAEEARRRLGLTKATRRSLGRDEARAWKRWAPLVLLLPGIERWSASDKRSLVAVIRAKGGPQESDYVARFDAHPKLRRAFLRLAQAPE